MGGGGQAIGPTQTANGSGFYGLASSGTSGSAGGLSSLTSGLGGLMGGGQQPAAAPLGNGIPQPGAGGGGQGGQQVQISQFPWLQMKPVIRALAQRRLS